MTQRSSFEQRWRERFVEFAKRRDDDAGIAGWSVTGLTTRFRFFRQLWQPSKPGSLYLDVGCGAATYTRWLAEQGMDPIGLDYSSPTLAKARARTPATIPLCAADAMQLPFRAATFDGALCFGVLQAVADSGRVVRELARVLKPGGVLWIDALNHAGLAARAERTRLRLKGKAMHLRYERPDTLERIVIDAGFTDVRRHWLPIMPGPLHTMQPVMESRFVRAGLASLTPVGALLSHAFVLSARREADR